MLVAACQRRHAILVPGGPIADLGDARWVAQLVKIDVALAAREKDGVVLYLDVQQVFIHPAVVGECPAYGLGEVGFVARRGALRCGDSPACPHVRPRSPSMRPRRVSC